PGAADPESATGEAAAKVEKLANTPKTMKHRRTGKRATQKAAAKRGAVRGEAHAPKSHETSGPIDARTLAARYKAVGAQLRALEQAKGPDAVSDLWSRYRFIRIADAMSTQPKRDQAAAILAKLTREIASRKK